MIERLRFLFDSSCGPQNLFVARWIFLRCLGLVYGSAFYSLLFQVRGLVGSKGILPAADLLQSAHSLGNLRFWYCPSLLWISSSDHMILGMCWVGLIASVFLTLNLWPRAALLVSFCCFLSFVAAAQDFSGYQSDGMLLEAGFISLFLAPAGFVPGLAINKPPIRAALLLLLWEWFRIYFQSGLVKLQSGDPTWRNLTALYEYYQNGPLPTWIGWYIQRLPHWFHRITAGATLCMELGLVWIAVISRRSRIICFFFVTLWQIAVIATANYAFLNYLVLVLAFLLLDDAAFPPALRRISSRHPSSVLEQACSDDIGQKASPRSFLRNLKLAGGAFCLSWIFYVTLFLQLQMFWGRLPLPSWPVVVLDPFRIANQYGLFAVMTPNRYEIEFQSSNDGTHWVAYNFQYKPQALDSAPGIYAPYQPRFDWNLWFASLGRWQENLIVPRTQELLLQSDRDVLALFANDPLHGSRPLYVRAVLWQYWFTPWEEHRATKRWWNRQWLGLYSPVLKKLSSGKDVVVTDPSLATQ